MIALTQARRGSGGLDQRYRSKGDEKCLKSGEFLSFFFFLENSKENYLSQTDSLCQGTRSHMLSVVGEFLKIELVTAGDLDVGCGREHSRVTPRGRRLWMEQVFEGAGQMFTFG